jgi:PTH1 family peptidyl-tRNA hydrolase
MAEQRFLVVGLGNPGPRYANTRHNAGFMVLEELGRRVGGSFKSHRSLCDICEGRLLDAGVVLAKPKSFMNESGGPIVSVSKFFSVPVAQIVVIHDELDLPLGTLRVKRGGGEGGHNGLRSASASLGSKDYVRVRVGIGRPPGRQDPADYVLKEFAKAERDELAFMIDRAADATESVISQGLEATQNAFNA